jgi:hypothetical protein
MKTTLALIAVLWGLIITQAGALPTNLVYQQTFNNTTGNNIFDLLNTYHWAIHETAVGDLYQVQYGGTAVGSSSGAGAPTGLGTTNGFIFNTSFNNFGGFTNRRMLAWTWDIASANLLAADLVMVNWYQGNAETQTINQVALKINGQWYVSSNGFNQSVAVSSGANFGTQAEAKSFSFASATWRILNFDGGTNSNGTFLNMGGTTTLGSGTVEAIGLYVDGTDASSRRFDSFQVYAIPEPSALALVGAGLLASALLRRRTQR